MPASLGGWDIGMDWRKEGLGDLYASLVMGNREEKEQQVFCYRANNETWGIASRGAEGELWICHQSTCCTGRRGLWFLAECLLRLGVGTKQLVRRGRLEREDL